MIEETRRPDFKSKNGGWVCWVNIDKNKRKYLSVHIEGIGKQVLFSTDDSVPEEKIIEERVS